MDKQSSQLMKSFARGARSKIAKAKRTYTCRTLKDLIKAYRACTTVAEERALVKKEAAHIRDLFKEGDTTFRRRNIAKLLFFHMNGYPTDFGMTECVKLCASVKFPDKRVAYLGLMILVEETEDILMLVTNALKRDLASDDQHIVGLSLTVLSDLASADMARDLLPEIEQHVESPNLYIRKKAALAAVRAVRKLPSDETPNLVAAVPRLFEARQAGAHISASSLVVALKRQGSANVAQLRATAVPAMLATLHDLLLPTNRTTSPKSNVVGGVRNPFLQIKILQALRAVATGASYDAVTPISDVLAQVAANTDVSTTLGTAVLYECVRTIVALKTEPSLRALAVSSLCRFLTHKDANVRYIGLQELVKVVSAGNAEESMEEHRGTITKALGEEDPSIKHRALELLHAIVGSGNAVEIASEMIAFLGKTADVELRESAVRKVCNIISQFSPSPEWRCDIFLEALEEVDSLMPETLVATFIAWVSEVTSVHSYVARKVYMSCLLATSGKGSRSGKDVSKAVLPIVDPFESMMAGAVAIAPPDVPPVAKTNCADASVSEKAVKSLSVNRRRARFERVCAYIFGEYGDSVIDRSGEAAGAISPDDAISALERLLAASGVDVTSFPSSALVFDPREDTLSGEVRLVRETCMTALLKLTARITYASSGPSSAGGLGSLGAAVAASAAANTGPLALDGPQGLLALENGASMSLTPFAAERKAPPNTDAEFGLGSDLLAGLGISDTPSVGMQKPAGMGGALVPSGGGGELSLLDSEDGGDSLMLSGEDMGIHPILVRVRRIFALHRQSPDTETQQRACEYSSLLSGNMASLRAVAYGRLPVVDYEEMRGRQKRTAATSFDVNVDETGADKPFSDDLLLLLEDDPVRTTSAPGGAGGSGLLALPSVSGGFDLDDLLKEEPVKHGKPAPSEVPVLMPSNPAIDTPPSNPALDPPPLNPARDSLATSGLAGGQPVAPATTVFSDSALCVSALFFKDSESSPGTTRVDLTYANKCDSAISKFTFQLSVPKYILSHMKPASSSSIPAGASATQAVVLENSMHGSKPVQLRFRIQFVLDSQELVQQGTLTAQQLPPGL